MKTSEQWLREWVNLKLNSTLLAEQLMMLGLNVDDVSPVAGDFSAVIVGEVLSVKPHPNAKKLSCCVVNVGAKKPLNIVCGAANVRPGIKVAVAMIGAMLPGDLKIKAAELRGESSEGMLCSQSELQLLMGKTEFSGIVELPSDAPIGKDFRAYFNADDSIFDIEITPNRGDCLSVLGIARELAAKNKLSLNYPAIKAVRAASKEARSITLSAKEACPRYVGRVIRHVKNNVPTPSWIQQRLERAHVRIVNLAVDICNYVMIELGQPMHAFDLAKLNGNIDVRYAKNGEKIQVLDESIVELSDKDLVIADQKNVLALAGIMGGLASGVSVDTTDIFLEAAFFSPKNICLSARRHRLTSDAAYRFERGVDYELPVTAIERATTLLLEIAGGEPGAITEAVAEKHLPKRDKIVLEESQIQRMLGTNIEVDRVSKILESLGMHVRTRANAWEVTPPSYRFDITQSIDLIEELARVYGYQHIPATPMITPLTMQAISETIVSLNRLRSVLVDRDYHEAITYSFIDPHTHALFSEKKDAMTLQNPISQDMSVMRDSLWPGLVEAIARNVRHQCDRVRLFETGLTFEKIDGQLIQTSKLGIVAMGAALPEQWGAKKYPVDFYSLKADIEALLMLSHSRSDYHFAQAWHAALHPGRSAAIYRGKKIVGWIGELHPRILSTLDIREPVIVAEIALEVIQRGILSQYQPHSHFPSVRRDLAILLDESVSAEIIEKAIAAAAGELLCDVQVFDIYQGKGVDSGKKSVALGLTFQHPARTLRDEEINQVIHHVVTLLERDLNATLRT